MTVDTPHNRTDYNKVRGGKKTSRNTAEQEAMDKSMSTEES